ncbi:hypothetical protein RGU42_05905 [Cryobacterium sp. 5B3]|nr:hypothetical protein [Cryobacterium sp. 5B3]MDY7541930.1 hypothetical protein [Cryobacterium sp. 5B3]MEB0276035.1 hypothetical protein [Cryobacterium sp. 5B3]
MTPPRNDPDHACDDEGAEGPGGGAEPFLQPEQEDHGRLGRVGQHERADIRDAVQLCDQEQHDRRAERVLDPPDRVALSLDRAPVAGAEDRRRDEQVSDGRQQEHNDGTDADIDGSDRNAFRRQSRSRRSGRVLDGDRKEKMPGEVHRPDNRDSLGEVQDARDEIQHTKVHVGHARPRAGVCSRSDARCRWATTPVCTTGRAPARSGLNGDLLALGVALALVGVRRLRDPRNHPRS